MHLTKWVHEPIWISTDQGHPLTLVQGHSDATFANFFSWETARPIEAKFHVELQWDGGTKVWSNGPGHMTKMVAIPIYGKFFSGTKRPMTLKVFMQHLVLKYYQICSNDDPGLTLTYFMARSNSVAYAFVWEKVKTMDFSETIIVYDIKVSRCSQVDESLMSTRGQGHSSTLVQITQIQYFYTGHSRYVDFAYLDTTT